jgi:hypothetical protein
MLALTWYLAKALPTWSSFPLFFLYTMSRLVVRVQLESTLVSYVGTKMVLRNCVINMSRFPSFSLQVLSREVVTVRLKPALTLLSGKNGSSVG